MAIKLFKAFTKSVAKDTPKEAPVPVVGVITAPNIPDSLVIKELEKGVGSISIIRLVELMIYEAFQMRASDIHVEPEQEDLRIRFRIDGVLHDIFAFPKEIHSEVITRIKVLTGLRTDEHQMAQDGRFKIKIQNAKDIDIRVSIAPTYYGENCVMRLLAEQSQNLTLESLGFSADNLSRIYNAIKRPHGMILVTGPTGSGKSTTLYTILTKLNTKEVSIITIEDPIEYSLPGVDQIQVNERTGLTFAEGLRFILRQDPNIIMVGEIRDDDTANIAVTAAMTGHLMLSTIHANDTATTLPRLIDMKVEPFLISSTLNIVIGQRLVRTICTNCKAIRKMSDVELTALQDYFPPELLKKNKFYAGTGCNECNGTGFRSRTGIHEVLEINEEVRDLIMKHANATEIKKASMKNGMITMIEDGFQKVMEGVTTIEEVLRVFHE